MTHVTSIQRTVLGRVLGIRQTKDGFVVVRRSTGCWQVLSYPRVVHRTWDEASLDLREHVEKDRDRKDIG